MRYFAYTLLILGLIISLSACAAQIPDPAAQQTLEKYLDRLHQGEYEEGTRLYGGSYLDVIDNNPAIDPEDHAALLKNACEINGYQCLEVRSITPEETSSAGETIFRVEFNNEDGTQFVRGPCCGGNATDDPPEASFLFRVVRGDDEKYLVMDLPPYVP